MATLLKEESVPFLPWSEFRPKFFKNWKQGEHVSIAAPTQVGKTYLTQNILELRRFVVVIACKVDGLDPTLEKYETDFNYRRIDNWPPPASLYTDHARELFWPKIKTRADINRYAPRYAKCLESIFSNGRWTVVLDDAIMLEDRMKLKLHAQDNLTMGGGKATFVSLAQRPVLVSKFTWGASSHAFLGRFDDDADARNLSHLGGVNAKRIRSAMASLNSTEHEILYVDSRAGAGELVKTKVDKR